MKAYRIHDGVQKWFVRGTDDPQVALDVLTDEYPEDMPEPEDVDLEYFPLNPESGIFRFNPCTCGEHGWHLGGPLRDRGRGRFLGVLLDVGAREIVYDSELENL